MFEKLFHKKEDSPEERGKARAEVEDRIAELRKEVEAARLGEHEGLAKELEQEIAELEAEDKKLGE